MILQKIKANQYVFVPQDFDNRELENEEENKDLCEALEKSLEEIDESSTVPVLEPDYASMDKGGKFLKKLWCCVGGNITR